MADRYPTLRAAFNYPGGKWFLKHKVLSGFSKHAVWVEAFAGSAVVSLNKSRSDVEVLNDVDPDVINTYGCMRDHWRELLSACVQVRYGKEAFEESRERLRTLPPSEAAKPWDIPRAVDYLVWRRWSRNGTGSGFAESRRARDGVPRWDRFLQAARFRAISDRLRGVALRSTDAIDLFSRYDSIFTAWYLDPPYMFETRRTKAKGLYTYEFTDDDHARLLVACQGLQGQVVISGYHSPLYESALANWERWEIATFNSMGNLTRAGEAASRTEVLWIKREA